MALFVERVIIDESKRIRFISPTKEGRKHDLALFLKELLAFNIPPGTSLWVDKGYTGIKSLVSPGVIVNIPKKPIKKSPFSILSFLKIDCNFQNLY